MPVSWITRAGDPRQKTDHYALFDTAKANICFLIGGRIAKSPKGLNIRGLVHVGTTTHDKEARREETRFGDPEGLVWGFAHNRFRRTGQRPFEEVSR